jgi:hypothetical protein
MMKASVEFSRRREEIGSTLEAVRDALAQLADADAVWVDSLSPIIEAEVARLNEELSQTEGSSELHWLALADISRKAERIAAEALAFVGGMAARSANLDQGQCTLADDLLRAITEGLLIGDAPITLLAASEYVDVLSEVVRVRYPGRGIWDLPIVIHELGHSVVARFTPTRDGDTPSTIIGRERTIARYRGAFADELWADTFAAYIGGPAYAFAALSRFEPSKARDDQRPTHPAPLTRAVVIFATLTRLQTAWTSSHRAGGSLAPMISLAEAFWSSRLNAAAVAPAPEEHVVRYASELAAEFVSILDREHVVLRYDDARAAAAVRRHLLEDEQLNGEYGLVDVLNGAWWARSEGCESSNRLAVIADTATKIGANVRVGGV